MDAAFVSFSFFLCFSGDEGEQRGSGRKGKEGREGGREEKGREGKWLINKSILINLPLYFMSTFEMPKGIVSRLEQLFRNVLWR